MIKINGKEYPVAFKLTTLLRIAEKKGYKDFKEFEKLFEGIKTTENEVLIPLQAFKDFGLVAYEGVREGCRIDKISFGLDVEDFINLLQDDPEEFVKILNIFSKSWGESKNLKPPPESGA